MSATASVAGSMGLPAASSGAGGMSSVSGDDQNFKVAIRVRPPVPRELHGDRPFQNVVRVDHAERRITISENLAAVEEEGYSGAPGPYSTHTFTFDHVYGQDCTQKKVYETTAKAVVESSLQGYNATIFAYGQTGTGKTYTMEGFDSRDARGIIPRAIEQIFQHITSSVSPRMRFLVRASYLQIYNENISDLLKPERTSLLIREDKRKGVYVEGLSEWVVRSPQEIYGLMERGGAMRATGSTRMNHLSSRSHAVFIIIAEQSETTYLDEDGQELSVEQFHRLVKSRAHGDDGLKRLEANVRQMFKVGKLNLVDLAGSERVRLTGATGQRLEESRKINQSLSSLGNVIAALTDPRGRQHIPYRDSKLTRILEDSLGGNCKTTMMAMISPALEAFVESLSTLKFANRAKNIKNEARVNEDLDQKSLLRRYERELRRLRTELEERSRNVVDKRRLLELDEQRRRAELDKMAAIRALEARSREFLREKEEKKRLEGRISALQGQMLTGGEGVTDTPAFRNALKEHQEKIRAKYDAKLHELEKERESMEEEKAQVDRYKQLLLKQRDIMILLTQRLNERDDQIVALQDELDAYDRHQRELEEKLDEKTAALIHLQRVALEHNTSSPFKSRALAEALGAWSGGQESSEGMPHPAAASIAGAAEPEAGPDRYLPYDSGKPARATATAVTTPGNASPVGGRDSAVFVSGPPSTLTAAEKIAELAGIVDALEARLAREARGLEQAQAEKASVEHVLRERVEQLVQSELESRLQDAPGSPAGSGADHHLRARVAELEAELQLAKSRPLSSDLDADRSAVLRSSPLVASLRARLDTHDKERKAIQTIVEFKIKALADSVASIAEAATDTTSPRLVREARALQRLVNASVAALRNAESEAGIAQAKEKALAARSDTGASASSKGSVPLAGSSAKYSRDAGTPGTALPAEHGRLQLSLSGRGEEPAVAADLAPAAQVTTADSPPSASAGISTSASAVDAMIRERKEAILRQRRSQAGQAW
ncbi:hypothetical protein FNF27_05044 [Cafeteria roenbergensis]|nr:hypothetical protein FNF27_05044 [Cafeteria roenbergensis]